MKIKVFHQQQQHSSRTTEQDKQPMNLSSIIDADATIDEPDIHRVFFLPLGLSALQRRLVEVLITLHRPSLVTQLRGEDSLTKNENQDEDVTHLSPKELESLLTNGLFGIANHPYLLVEHYMPKRLLLMESHERLMDASDKFAKFDKLIGAIADIPLDVIVVGHNIKELDLIEAFVLGRKLIYKRYSGTSLYEFKKVDQQNTTNSDKKLSAKDDDYMPKYKPPKAERQVRLHLITSHQLSSSPFIAVQPQFIVSFDAMLDENNPNLQYLRLAHTEGVPVPLIKLLVMQSHLHGVIANQDFTLEERKVKQRALYSSLVLRNLDLTQQFEDECGVLFQNVRKFFQDPITNSWPIDKVPEFIKHTDQEVLKSLEIDDHSISQGQKNKKIKLEKIIVPEKMTSVEYKSLLARLTIERINVLHNDIEVNKQELKPLRLNSTLMHSSEDSMKLSIGSVFKNSLTLKEQATSAEKRLERLELEYEKFHEKEVELEQQRQVLEMISKDEKTLDDLELNKEIEELQQVLSTLQQETKDMGDKTDGLRQEYQIATSTAADNSTKLNTYKDLNKSLVSKLEGQGMKLRQLTYQERRLTVKDQVSKMNNELKFLEFYNSKLSETVKQRGATLNVGRNGRVHRSTTPYL